MNDKKTPRDRLGSIRYDHRIELQKIHTGNSEGIFSKQQFFGMKPFLAASLNFFGFYRRGKEQFRNIQLAHHHVEIRNLPKSFENFTILQLSDLHLDIGEGITDAIIEKINAIHIPYDICVITGDFRYKTSGNHDPCVQELKRILPFITKPIYAVLGNHDPVEIVTDLEDLGITVLLNESITLAKGGEQITLVGVDDPHFYRIDDLHYSLKNTPQKNKKILLAHSPEIYERAAKCGIDYMLCGHTHGGQVCLPGNIPLMVNADIPRKFARGSWEYQGLQGYTSPGTGSSVLPIRLNCTPEMTLHTLKCQQQEMHSMEPTLPYNILGIPVDHITIQGAVDHVLNLIRNYRSGKNPHAEYIATVNLDFLVKALSWNKTNPRHPELLRTLREASLVTADGMPIVWLSKIMGTPLPERVAGSDLVEHLARELAKEGRSVFFLGGPPGLAQKAAKKLENSFPGLKIAGAISPTISVAGRGLVTAEEHDQEVIEYINNSGADLLFIGLGNPKQELWYRRIKNRIKVPVSIGIGGAFHFIAGNIPRAPEAMRTWGLEWLYRLYQEPKRLWKRYLVDFVKFGYLAAPLILSHFFHKFLLKKMVRKHPEANEVYIDYAPFDGGELHIIRLPCDTGIHQTEEILSALNKLHSYSNVAIDFSQVKFMDSAGIGLLLKYWKERAKDRKKITLGFGMSRSLKRLLKHHHALEFFSPYLHVNQFETTEFIKSEQNNKRHTVDVVNGEGLVVLKFNGLWDSDAFHLHPPEQFLDNLELDHTIVDLSHCSFMDHRGLGIFLRIQQHLDLTGHKCVVCGLNPTLKQAFKIAEMDPLFDVTPTFDLAKQKIDGR